MSAPLSRETVRAAAFADPVTTATFTAGPPPAVARSGAKRVMDLVIGVPLLVFVSPVLIAVAVAVMLDSRGPILFRQRRRGLRGEIFHVFKFRTMHTVEDGAAAVQATKNDKRVTRIGRFLRRSSLDELPQLLNVLRGEMSLVGPRPHPLKLDDDFDFIENYKLRQLAKPGITGWAQVNGHRGETDTVEKMVTRVDHDLYYIQNWTLMFDFGILVGTIRVVLGGKNAY